MPPGKAGRWFTAVMAAEWKGVLDQKRKPKIPLVFAHMVMKRTLRACKAREIQARIDRQLDLWERGIHPGLVGYVLAERRSREIRIEQSNEEEEDLLARSFYSTLILGEAAAGGAYVHRT